jgi:hypothetical protein
MLRLRRRCSRVVDRRRAAHVVSQSFSVLSVVDISFHMEAGTGCCQFLTRTQQCLFPVPNAAMDNFSQKIAVSFRRRLLTDRSLVCIFSFTRRDPGDHMLSSCYVICLPVFSCFRKPNELLSVLRKNSHWRCDS